MKQLCCLLLLAASFCTSCVSKKVVERAENQRDSLNVVVASKDSLLNAVFADINAISENLSAIKARENLLTIDQTPEGGRRPIAEINRDIAAINRLLEENRAKIASLERTSAQLRKANLRIDELEKTIANLTAELGEKGAEIERLRAELGRREHEVVQLTQQVEETQQQLDNLSGDKIELENQLNTVYYIVGVEKELRDAQIINKQGFIGRTLTVSSTDLRSFTQADSRLLREIPLGYKKVSLVTSHPEGSYQLIVDADKVATKLVIDNPDRFWESSKILVISHK